MGNIPTRVAIVYDRVNKWGGAEQVLLALHEIFPTAPLFTSVYHEENARWAAVFPAVIPSFLQHFPLARSHHELYPLLTPMAFESFNFRSYEMVISVTSSDAKGIITTPNTFHLCYCLTPTRYLWVDPPTNYEKILSPLFNYLKNWDQTASKRPDHIISISKNVQSRVKQIYNSESSLVYPPVELSIYKSKEEIKVETKDNFLFVGRMVYHKKPDQLIRLFNELNLPLIMAGTGNMDSYLRSIASSNIKFTGLTSPGDLLQLYKTSKALVTVHNEDFGITYVEAQASGLPVIALNEGAVGEIVVNNQTGILSNSVEELKQVLMQFDKNKFDFNTNHLTSFSKEKFKQEFASVVSREWTKYKHMH